MPSAGPAMTPRLPEGPVSASPCRRLAPALASPASASRGKPSVLRASPRRGPGRRRVARALGATLDVLVVRKIGHPDVPELGLGAIAEDGAGGAAEPFFDQRDARRGEPDARRPGRRGGQGTAELARRAPSTAGGGHGTEAADAGRHATWRASSWSWWTTGWRPG